MSKTALAMIVGLGAGALALLALVNPAKGAPPEEGVFIPSVSNILACENLVELEVYYDLINELYVTGEIDEAEYTNLYDAYVQRWSELAGVS